MQPLAAALDRETRARSLDEPLRFRGPSPRSLGEKGDERPAPDRLDDIEMEQTPVEALPRAELGDVVAAVVVVGHERYEGEPLLAPPVRLEGERERPAAAPQGRGDQAERGDEPVPGLPGRVVDEARVDPQRDVVQEDAAVYGSDVDSPLLAAEGREGGERIVGVEAEVAGEVVPRAEGHAGERQVSFQRDLRHGGERAVAPGGADGRRAVVCGLPRERSRIVPRPELTSVDPEPAGLRDELLRRGRTGAGTRIDEEEGAGAKQRLRWRAASRRARCGPGARRDRRGRRPRSRSACASP